MKVLSLFSGGGLGDLGLMAAGMEIVGQVEIDDYCQKILALRYPETEKWKDIKNVEGKEVIKKCGKIDVITGGFPCQPFSNAGAKMGKSDDRHLWPEMFRIISEIKPAWVIGENVSGFVDMALDDVLANLESIGYETTTFIFPAHALGAWHRRERVWIVGYAGLLGQAQHEKQTTGVEQSSKNMANPELRRHIHGQTQEQSAEGRLDAQREPKPSGSDVPDTAIDGRKRRPTASPKMSGWGTLTQVEGCDRWRKWWAVEPAVGRVAYGIAHRIHRLKCLGNGQVPACTFIIGKIIMDLNK